ncbi:MAG TPA: hypothetical protein PKO06_16845, partial [Candidatus Ozemobacteraceae bacterium]|nr:hypothetical protein [Candidatus Ozemobacteraceae bacterium]
MERSENPAEETASECVETGPRFALRLALDEFLHALAGLLPGFLTAERPRSMAETFIVRKTGVSELARVRELQLYLGPTAEPAVVGKRQLQLWIRGTWTREQLLAQLQQPGGPVTVDRQEGQEILVFRHLPDFVGWCAADGALVVASRDLIKGSRFQLDVPILSPEKEHILRRHPLAFCARRGGPWWQACARWVNSRLARDRDDLAQALDEAARHVCGY